MDRSVSDSRRLRPAFYAGWHEADLDLMIEAETVIKWRSPELDIDVSRSRFSSGVPHKIVQSSFMDLSKRRSFRPFPH